MGIFFFYFWFDVFIFYYFIIVIFKNMLFFYGEFIVKYRGFFINDEYFVFWGWVVEKWNRDFWELVF